MLQAEPNTPITTLNDVTQTSQKAASVQSKYFQAEDLVLRAIQAEYGATVSRQVIAGSDMGFDGVFVTNGRLNIVEVKYVTSPRSFPRLRESLDRLAAAVARYGWGNVQIVLAVVFENPEDVSEGMGRLQELTLGMRTPVAIRVYAFSDLQRRFGVSSQPGSDVGVGPVV